MILKKKKRCSNEVSIIIETQIINQRIILPLLFSENVAVKLWEKHITVKVGHDVGEIDEITPWMLKTFLNSTVTNIN